MAEIDVSVPKSGISKVESRGLMVAQGQHGTLELGQ